MGKKQQSGKGGAAGRQNILAAKNEISLVDELRKGRHECLCQARIHKLVLNCLGCGRIVCEQEGSGPCFTCRTLVCTREEREILNRGTNKSRELLGKLMAGSGEDGTSIGSLKGVSSSYQTATEFRNKLLEADADTERRTKVNDLQSDYSTIENSPFLSSEDREALKLRREELRALREKERKKFVVILDLDGGVVQEVKTRNGFDDHHDPVIQRIMDRVDEKHRIQEALFHSTADARWNPIGFVPKYLTEGNDHPATGNQCSDGDIIDADSLMIVSDELAAQITEEKGIVLSLVQPVATFVTHGLCRFLKFPTDLTLKGPLFISAKAGGTDEKAIREFAKKYVRDSAKLKDLDFADGAVLGRAFLQECLLVDDFLDKYGGAKADIPGTGNFVLCFSAFEPLVSAIPHISTADSDVYEMDRQLKRSLTKW